MESKAAICGGMVEVESSGERHGLGLSGEGTRGRDHWTGLKTMGSKVGLRLAGRLLKSRGRTGKAGRGMLGGVGAAVGWTPVEVGVGVEEEIGTVKRGVMVRESFRTRGRSGAANAGSDGDSEAGSEAGCSDKGKGEGEVAVMVVGVGVGADSADSAGVGSSTGN